MEITVKLPERVFQDVSTVAKKSKRKVVDLIIAVVEEKYSQNLLERPFSDYSDEDVLALAKLQIPKKQSDQHSKLLYKNQAGTINSDEKNELEFYQQVYGVALARKTDGIYEAVQRNLIKSPSDLDNE